MQTMLTRFPTYREGDHLVFGATLFAALVALVVPFVLDALVRGREKHRAIDRLDALLAITNEAVSAFQACERAFAADARGELLQLAPAAFALAESLKLLASGDGLPHTAVIAAMSAAQAIECANEATTAVQSGKTNGDEWIVAGGALAAAAALRSNEAAAARPGRRRKLT